MGNHEFIRQAKKRAMTGMTVTVCGFALMMLQGSMTASASTDKPTTTGNQPTTEVQPGANVASNTATLQERKAPETNPNTNGGNTTGNKVASPSNDSGQGNGETNNNTNTGDTNNGKGDTDKTNGDKTTKSAFDINKDVTNIQGSLTGHTLTGSSVTIDGTHSATFNNATKDTKIYQWVFLMDGNNELGRQQVPDYMTKNIHVVFDLSKNTGNWKSDPLHVIFRYTTNPAGDGPFNDWTSGSFDFLKETVQLPNEIKDDRGWYDTIAFEKDGLHVVGWNTLQWSSDDHAKELENGTIHHFIEVVDQQGHVLGSVEVTGNSIKRRTDVNNVYPNFYDSVNSGFDVIVPVSKDSNWDNGTLTVRSIYTTATTADKANSSNSVAYNSDSFTRFKATALPQGQEMGSLDNVTYSSGKLHVDGWNTLTWPQNEVDPSHLHH